MSDVICPKFGVEQEINHDDGYGYCEDVRYEQACDHCGYEFEYTTMISFHYMVFCSGDHNLEPAGDRWPGLMLCKKCDYSVKRGAA